MGKTYKDRFKDKESVKKVKQRKKKMEVYDHTEDYETDE